MNASKIKEALSIFHLKEKSSSNPEGLTRVQATEYAIKHGPNLTHSEVDILLNVVNVKRTEITVQFK